MGHVILNGGIETDRLLCTSDESRRCHGVATRKQSHIMPLLHQGFTQMRDDAFRSPI